MGKLLEGRVAIVTGSGRGLGRAEALALAAEGAKVVVNDLGGASDGSGKATAPADEVVQEIKKKGGQAVANYASVTTPEGAESIVKTAVDTFGKLDILVNNAGILRDRMVFNMTPEEWDSVIKVHLYGTFYCTRYASVVMRQQKYGRIINTTSHSALGNMGQSNYAAAKEGITGFTRTVARDLGRYGITCNAIRPRAGTRMTINPALKAAWVKMWGEAKAEEHARDLEATLPPEAIATFVTYLATEQADNVNACIFEVWRGHIGIYNDPPPVAQVLWKSGDFSVNDLLQTMPTTLVRGKIRELPPSAFSAET